MKILSLSGFIPEQIVDTVRFTQYNGQQSISHYCGYAADYISQVLEDVSIDGAVFPRSCDSTRVIPDYLSDCNKFSYQLNVPARQDQPAIDFFSNCIKCYKESVENHYGIILNQINERVQLVNARNRNLAQLYQNISEFSYADYLTGIHSMLLQPLDKQGSLSIKSSVCKSVKKKRVYIVGSFLSNIEVVSTIENTGLNIVGDNLTESKRLFSAPSVSTIGDVYNNISESILHNRLSPTQNNFREIIQSDLDEIKCKKVEGVIFVTQKYCEPYDYLFAVYKKFLDDNNIPFIHIKLTDSTDNKKSAFAIEAFAEIL
ncbi:MAG: 2-hydroxyacyl-CoA dehydratase family protein [Hydrogenoanaerobacterium sp.]